MKVKFEYTKKDYKRYLIKNRMINNIVIFVIGILLYLIITKNNVSLLFLPVFALCLLIVIGLLNIIYVALYLKMNDMMNYNTYGNYVVEFTPNKFSVTLNKSKVDYKYKNIKKIIERKNEFKIKFKKSRETLTFEKRKIDEKEYQKMLQYIKDKA